MAFNWQAQANVHGSPSQALLDVQHQHQQQQQQRQNVIPLQHHASYHGPTANAASSTMDGMAQMGAGSAMAAGMAQGSSAPSNADIDAIWSNYQPNKIPISFNGTPSQGQQFMMQPQRRSNTDASTAASMNNFTPMSAATAAAAYSQLGFPAPQQASMSNDGMSAQWNGSSNNTDIGFQSAGGGGLVAPPKRLAHLSSSNVGYEGDASNSSSTQTPGASSGDDSNGEKRKQQQAISGGGVASAMHRVGSGQTLTQHTLNGVDGQFDTSNVSTRRGSLDRKTGLTSDAAAGSRPLLKHRRSHSGSQVPSTNNAYVEGDALMSKRLSIHGHPLHQQHSTSVIASMAPYAQSLSGHAASHPPGLGNNVLRGVDVGTGGSQAATGFTKRKGWYNRIVDELLDFVHVLDAQGRILYAASSVGTLTGWNLEELRGKKIDSLIHPDDAPAFMKELNRCFRDRTELTTYYRFRKKPKTAADKQRVRDQRAASNAGQSNSASASENDSSSNPEPTSKTTFADGLPEDNVDLLYDDDADLSDDRDDRYVIFEVTGHPYVAPNEGEDATTRKLDGSPTKSPARTKSMDATLKAKKSAENVAGSADAEDDTKAATMAAASDMPKDVQCFFCSGRVYPTKTVGMLDSFLEYKLENERLRMLLSELSVNDGSGGANFGETSSSDGRRSLEGYPLDYPRDHDGQTNSIGHGAASLGSVETVEATTTATGAGYEGSSNSTGMTNRKSTFAANDMAAAMSSPVSPRTSTAAAGASVPPTAGSAYDSDDKEDDDSDGNMSPSLDALGGADDDDKPKKKKPKGEEGDYVCTDCGRVDSPEWRKGPLGPKTLCNACGLRWAKKVKRSGGDPNAMSKAGAAMKKGHLMAAGMSSTGSQGGGGGGGVQIQQSGMPVNLMQQQLVNGNSFGGGSSTMSRPSLSSTNTGSSASMYGHMPSFGQMVPGPGSAPHNNAMFDHNVIGSGGPPQNMYGVHHNMAADAYGTASGGGAPPSGMPPLIHHGSSFMSQSSASAPAHPGMTFQQQQQQQQQFQQPNNGGGGAPNLNMMPHSANNAAMFVNMHSGMPDYNQMG